VPDDQGVGEPAELVGLSTTSPDAAPVGWTQALARPADEVVWPVDAPAGVPAGWPETVAASDISWPQVPATLGEALGWPEHLSDQPFDQPFDPPLDQPFDQPFNQATRLSPASPDEPATAATASNDRYAALADELVSPTVPTGRVARSTVEQAEEEHLGWLRNLPDSREDEPEHPPAHQTQPLPAYEPPRRQWIERILVGVLAAMVTFAATRWADASWTTAAWIGATVLLVVPTVAWVATLGHRQPRRTDPTTRVGT